MWVGALSDSDRRDACAAAAGRGASLRVGIAWRRRSVAGLRRLAGARDAGFSQPRTRAGSGAPSYPMHAVAGRRTGTRDLA